MPHTTDCSIRPPSSGNPGSTLNAAMNRLTAATIANASVIGVGPATVARGEEGPARRRDPAEEHEGDALDLDPGQPRRDRVRALVQEHGAEEQEGAQGPERERAASRQLGEPRVEPGPQGVPGK